MKRGYLRILIFEILLFLVLILNSFIKNIFNRFTIIIFLIAIILIFKKMFGVEKERKRYIKDIILEVIIVCLVSFILYYLFGLVTSFYRNENYLTLYGISEILAPTILFIVLKEYLRQLILTKSEGSKILYVATGVLFVLLELTNVIPFAVLTTKEGMFDFVAIYLLPTISNNIVASYVAIKGNYKVNILWLLITQLYVFVLPIIPNTGDYILSVMRVIFPFIIFSRLKTFFDKESDEYLVREYNKKQIFPIIVATLVTIIVVYFTSGYFKYYAVAIASGSMKPNIDVGDVVIIEKINGDYASLAKNQVIAYKYGGVTVVHRINKIVKIKDEYYFYTKGDANSDIDGYVVQEDMIIGIVNIKIPYIGLPTVWFSKL